MQKLFVRLFILVALPCVAHAQGNACVGFLKRLIPALAKPAFLEPVDDEPQIYRQLFLSKSMVHESKKRLAKTPVAELPRRAFEAYVEHRLAPYSKDIREQIIAVIENSKIVDSQEVVALGHVTSFPELSRQLGRPAASISIRASPKIGESAFFYAVLSHELEHVIQIFDQQYGTFADPNLRYFQEFAAVRAEWEYWKLIPNALINVELEIWETIPRDMRSSKNLFFSLVNAHASFPKYLSHSPYRNRGAVNAIYSDVD